MYCIDGHHLTSETQMLAYWQAHYSKQRGVQVRHPTCHHILVSLTGLPCAREATCLYTKSTQNVMSEYFVAKRAGGCCGG